MSRGQGGFGRERATGAKKEKSTYLPCKKYTMLTHPQRWIWFDLYLHLYDHLLNPLRAHLVPLPGTTRTRRRHPHGLEANAAADFRSWAWDAERLQQRPPHERQPHRAARLLSQSNCQACKREKPLAAARKPGRAGKMAG